MPRPPGLAFVLSAAFLTTAACGGDGDDGPDGATGRFGAIHTAVCRAAAQAADGELAGARTTFDDVHVGLHDLATGAGEADRRTAARLLEAKQRVETRLDADTLEALAGSVATAVEATGGTAPESCR